MTDIFEPGTPDSVYDDQTIQSFIESLPIDEQNPAMVTLLNLQNLSSFVNDFASAVALHLHVEQLRASITAEMSADTDVFKNNMRMLKSWDEVCGRELSISVAHIGKTLFHLKTNLRLTPSIKADELLLRKATAELDRTFPNYNLAKHAAGHRAESMASLDKVRKHAVETDDGPKFISGIVQGSTFVSTYDKKLVAISMTEDARSKLANVVATIYSAFPSLVSMLPELNYGSRPVSNEA